MTRSGFRGLIGLTIAIAVASGGALHAQTATGRIVGTARDATGAVLPGVTVTAKSLETGALRTAITDAAGTYQILSIPTEDYAVEASLAGFQTARHSPVTVTVGAA